MEHGVTWNVGVTWTVGVTWDAAISSASYSGTETVRLASWDGIGRFTSVLSYRGLQVSDSSSVVSFAGILYSFHNQN